MSNKQRRVYVNEDLRGHISFNAKIAQLVEHHPSKVNVAGSTPAFRSNTKFNNMNEKITPHFIVSVAKSFLRIGGFSILLSSLPLGIGVLIAAEILSIFEELV